MPIGASKTALVGTYDHGLVALSVLIAIVASYAALDLGGRVTAAQGRLKRIWLAGGSATMGLGIWAMHYIGMLAWSLPVTVLYDWPTVLLSLLVAMLASGVALFVVSRNAMGPLRICSGGLLMGMGIAGMHYIGMEAMRLPAMCHYSAGLVAWSVILAIVISLIALWLTFQMRNERSSRWWKLASAILMGAAIPVMHYTGMAAVTLVPTAPTESLSHSVEISTLGTFVIACFTLVILSLTILTALIDRRFSAQAIDIQRSMDDAVAARERAEKANQALRESEAQFRSLVEGAPDAIFVQTGYRFSYLNPAACQLFGAGSPEQLLDQPVMDRFHSSVHDIIRARIQTMEKTREPAPMAEQLWLRLDGNSIPVDVTKVPITYRGHDAALVFARDITGRKQLEIQLAQAQKLESIGQLAAGIAHEINTPIQYVGDNTRFLQDAIGNLLRLGVACDRYIVHLDDVELGAESLAAMKRIRNEVDIDYLQLETPKAIEQSLEGVTRVSSIVRAMKEFSHPGVEGKAATDINHGIHNTTLVSKNEWKFVADLVEDFDPGLPPVSCIAGEINQVVLNLIVNAAHAIADVTREPTGQKGTIRIRTRRENDWVRIEVQDTGSGIPESARPHIFNLFYTTKPVGKGTGQGLAFAYASVVQKHSGTIAFETEVGVGTTFIIRLPLSEDVAKAA